VVEGHINVLGQFAHLRNLFRPWPRSSGFCVLLALCKDLAGTRARGGDDAAAHVWLDSVWRLNIGSGTQTQLSAADYSWPDSPEVSRPYSGDAASPGGILRSAVLEPRALSASQPVAKIASILTRRRTADRSVPGM